MADNLPTLPVALQEAQRLANDPKTTVAQLAEIIGRDQALSGKVLKMVNSATYGFPGRIASVQNALVLLGFNIVKSLLLSAMVFESASKGMSELWRHSSGCAVACREIGRLLKMENTDECFIAGLLHDIGKVVTAVQLPEAHAEITHIAREEDILFNEAEERVLGMAHPHVGAWLVSQWNLPVSLRQAIAYHHRPAKAQDPITLACIVHVGDFLACLFECGDSGNPHVPLLDPHAFKHLELSQQRLGMAVDAVGEIFEQGRIL
ncbi:MAG: HDOD domain-containing protein [Deltaproteobacteria bacterium]|nr:HDOD domain-containing protein [Deltaproteobacteria bacterium]